MQEQSIISEQRLLTDFKAEKLATKFIKEDLRLLSGTLEELSYLSGLEMAVVIDLNKEILVNEINKFNIEVRTNSTPEIDAFRKLEKELVMRHAVKDANGSPRYNNEGKPMIANAEAYNKEVMELRNSNPVAVAQITSNSERLQKILQEEIEIVFWGLPFEKLSQQINAMQWRAMQFMVIPDKSLNLTSN